MEASNIIGGSNIYPCKGSPLSDQEFVNQIEDYNYIKTIYEMIELQRSSVHLTKKQMELLKIEMRCTYAPNDPCWGYINGQGIKSRCVEGECHKIKQCNPTYTREQTDYWRMNEKTRSLYGRPDKQKKYYLVDLVSDEEMLKYISDPKGAGREYPTMKETEQNNLKQKPKGRHLVVIGYEETYFGDADDQFSPIWGYVDDSEDKGLLVENRYGSRTEYVYKNAVREKQIIKKKATNKFADKIVPKKSSKTTINIEKLSAEKRLDYEKAIKEKLENNYQLTEMNSEILNQLSSNQIMNIILSNEAEMAYVSSMLLQASIAHDIEIANGCEKVCLWRAQSKTLKLTSDVAMVTSNFIKQGCELETETAWNELKKISSISEIVVTGREFFHFTSDDGQERWGCRNLYGATHLAVRSGDLELTESISGEQKITLMKDAKNYIILSTSSAEQVGTTSGTLWSALESLKKTDEIYEFPRMITGLILTQTKSGIELKGIGHMKFDEY